MHTDEAKTGLCVLWSAVICNPRPVSHIQQRQGGVAMHLKQKAGTRGTGTTSPTKGSAPSWTEAAEWQCSKWTLDQESGLLQRKPWESHPHVRVLLNAPALCELWISLSHTESTHHNIIPHFHGVGITEWIWIKKNFKVCMKMFSFTSNINITVIITSNHTIITGWINSKSTLLKANRELCAELTSPQNSGETGESRVTAEMWSPRIKANSAMNWCSIWTVI